MTPAELKASLSAIRALEDAPEIDWQKVDSLCLETIRRLVTEPAPDYPHGTVFRFLDDPDIRQKDEGYARVQRERLRSWLAAA